MTVKNALLTSFRLFVDLTTTHLTLYFEYADGSQQAGPFKLSDRLLRALANVAGERTLTEVRNVPCRVLVDDNGEIVAFAHFTREPWHNFEQPNSEGEEK